MPRSRARTTLFSIVDLVGGEVCGSRARIGKMQTSNAARADVDVRDMQNTCNPPTPKASAWQALACLAVVAAATEGRRSNVQRSIKSDKFGCLLARWSICKTSQSLIRRSFAKRPTQEIATPCEIWPKPIAKAPASLPIARWRTNGRRERKQSRHNGCCAEPNGTLSRKTVGQALRLLTEAVRAPRRHHSFSSPPRSFYF
jgi:hypothetical protein